MRGKIAAILTVFSASAASADPGDLMDEKTHQLTDRGAIALMIGGAEVSELRCGLKGQISAAIRKADRLGLHFDLNNKVDFSDVLFFATNITSGVKQDGWGAWCQNYKDTSAKLFNE
ncbi:hypothetical protein QNJ95_42710 [Bradyrhizobium elkanii]|uniref:hypothetical protein n=1 Tax=Bradyrhizobium TaxID=374 RepID=UPI002711E8FF|nr:hypothetical protein [Bradyrhizobium elkanii]WLA39483.1 hypothetical protein QNJ95_42710 [Bradyrhizobium elkanii]